MHFTSTQYSTATSIGCKKTSRLNIEVLVDGVLSIWNLVEEIVKVVVSYVYNVRCPVSSQIDEIICDRTRCLEEAYRTV